MSASLSKTDWRAFLKQQKGPKISKTGISDLLEKIESANNSRDDARRIAALKALITKAQTLKKDASIKGAPKVVKYLTEMIDLAQEQTRQIQVGETKDAEAPDAGSKQADAKADDADDENVSPLAKLIRRALKADNEHPLSFVATPGKPSSGLVLSRRKLTNQDLKAAMEMRGKRGAHFSGLCYGESGWLVCELEKEPPQGLAKGIKLAAKLHANLESLKVKVRGGGVEITDEDDDDSDLEAAGGDVPGEPKASTIDYPTKDIWIQRIKSVAAAPKESQAESSTGVYGQVTRYLKLLAEDQALSDPERAKQKKLLESVRVKLDQVLGGTPGVASPRVDRGKATAYDSLDVWRERIEATKRLNDEARRDAREKILVALGATAEKIQKDETLSAERRTRELKVLADARALIKTATRHQDAVRQGARHHEVADRLADAEERVEALVARGLIRTDEAKLRKAHASVREALKHRDSKPVERSFEGLETVLTQLEAKHPAEQEATQAPTKQQARLKRRIEKARASLNILTEDDPQRLELEQRIKTAERGKDVNAAYHSLKEVKFAARRAAAAKRDGICASDISDELRPLLAHSERMENFAGGALERQKSRAFEIFGNLADLEPISKAANKEDAFRRLAELNTHLDGIRSDLASLEIQVAGDKAHWAGMLSQCTDWDDALKRANHNMALLKKEKPDQFKPELQKDVALVVSRIKKLGLKGNGEKFNVPLDENLRDLNAAYDEKVKQLKAFDGFDSQMDSLTDHSGAPVASDQIAETKEEMAERFAIVERQAAERLERAKQEYLDAVKQDEVLTSATRSTRRRRPSLRTFDTADFFDDLYGQLQTGRKTDPGQLAQTCHAEFERMVADLIANNPDGDVLFDLATRTDAEWKEEVTRSLGAPTNEEDQPPEQTELIKLLADDMARTIRNAYPNRMEADLSELTIKGVIYSSPQKLGKGANATAYRYTNQQTGEAVVLKVPKVWPTIYSDSTTADQARDNFAEEIENTRGTMSAEARNHRQAAGGESSDCHPNILDEKGLALGPNGEPLVVMDMADAGDADKFSRNVDAACSAGLISHNARNAVMKSTMRQVVRGLKALQDQNVAHFDLKEENIFVRGDGTFAVADFGGGARMQNADDFVVEPVGHTPFYDAPEVDGDNEVTQKADVFSLGVVLQNMMDLSKRTREVQMIREKESKVMFSREQTTGSDGSPNTESSFTRLTNALLDPDPSKRPTMDAVLFSSFFNEDDDTYDEADLQELMEASAAYSKAVGKRVSKLQKKISIARNRIARLELEKTGEAEKIDIEVQTREIKSQQRLLDRKKKDIKDFSAKEKDALEAGVNWAVSQLKQLEGAVKNTADDIEKLKREVDSLNEKLGAPRTAGEVSKFEAEIEEQQVEIKAWEEEIENIHQQPSIAPHVMRLQKANEAFQDRA